MKALFLAQGTMAWASSRYRAWWVAEAAAWADGMLLRDALEDGVPAGYDAVIFPKTSSPPARALMRACRERGQLVFWDVCDPVWWLRPADARAVLPLVDWVVVSSSGLAEDLRAELGQPSTVIADRMAPGFHPTVKAHQHRARPVLLWYGQGWNRLASLSGALLTLHRLAAEGVQFRLRVLDDGAPDELHIDGVDVEYHRWRLESFHDELLAADVALTPPYPGPWGRMKSLNRRVTAWWAGLPTAEGAHPAHLKALLTDARFRAEVGAHNRSLAETRYDVAQSAEEWEQLIRRFMNRVPVGIGPAPLRWGGNGRAHHAHIHLSMQ